jgi:hypothetical protein
VPWLENLLHTIVDSPLFLSIGALILLVFLLSAVLRVAKLALIATLLLVGYVGYLHFSGGDVPQEVRKAEQVLEQSARQAGRALKDNAQVAGEAVRNAAENVGERLEQGFDNSASADASPLNLDVRGEVSGADRGAEGLSAEPDSVGFLPEF